MRIAAVRGMSWRGNEAQVDLLLEVSNPRGWSLTLNDIRLRCSFNGVATATGNSTAGLVLPAHGQADVPVRVNIDGPALLAVLAALPPDGTVRYELDGDAEIGDTMLRVPFQQQGHVVLR
ncbi:MAG: LEA type 2 family protein [Betaproteobacteria bacterium]|nr:LEA type 2 family protein [Betaproteobacteria bacterium]